MFNSVAIYSPGHKIVVEASWLKVEPQLITILPVSKVPAVMFGSVKFQIILTEQ